jgi:hypothetical protein
VLFYRYLVDSFSYFTFCHVFDFSRKKSEKEKYTNANRETRKLVEGNFIWDVQQINWVSFSEGGGGGGISVGYQPLTRKME